MATSFTADIVSAGTADTAAVSSRPSFFKRFVTALIEARERAAEREIERYITAHGGTLTDSIERDLSRTFGYPAGK